MAIFGCLFAAGCATAHQPVDVANFQNTAQSDAPALALACDPSIIANQPPLYLDRPSREPAAFAGYEQSTVTASYTQTYDDYIPIWGTRGTYDREAVSQKVDVLTR